MHNPKLCLCKTIKTLIDDEQFVFLIEKSLHKTELTRKAK